MIVHVAAAGEARGRVVLLCGFSPAANDAALKAAIHVAKAYHSEIEAVFVEDRHVFALADYDFASEIEHAGGTVCSLDAARLQAEYRALHAAESRRVFAIAAAAGIEARVQRVRDDEISALVRCCAASGPWNVVVIAEASASADGGVIGRVLDSVQDATGVVAATRRSRLSHGPIVVAVEDEDRLPVMVRTAERLSAVQGSEIKLLIVAASEDEMHWLEAQARLLVAGNSRCAIELNEVSRRSAAAIAERIRALGAAFLITRHGGQLLPQDGYNPLATLRYPVFCIR